MKFPHTTLVLLVLAVRTTLAELTYTITGTRDGKTINPSDIKLEPFTPTLHRLNVTTNVQPVPPTKERNKNRHAKRGNNAVFYSSNWCGVVQHSPSSNAVTNVHAYFQVPTLSARPGVTGFPQYVATWVGIDGATWGNALLQSGVTSQLSSTGVQTNWAWFEWIPDAAYNWPSFPVAPGNWIEVIVHATTSTSAWIVINNLDQPTHYNITLNGGAALGRVDADFIIEDPTSTGGPVPLASFSDTWFEETVVTTADGSTKNVDGAIMYYMPSGKCVSTQYDSTNFWTTSS